MAAVRPFQFILTLVRYQVFTLHYIQLLPVLSSVLSWTMMLHAADRKSFKPDYLFSEQFTYVAHTIYKVLDTEHSYAQGRSHDFCFGVRPFLFLHSIPSPPPNPARGLWSAVSSPSRVRGGALTVNIFTSLKTRAVRRRCIGRRRRLTVLRPAAAARCSIFIGGGGVGLWSAAAASDSNESASMLKVTTYMSRLIRV